ncbi:MAG: ubiquitin-like small modifier protein 1 [Dehalococcoidia bacterium]
MSVEVRIPSLLQSFVGGSKSVTVEGQTVGQLLDSLDSLYPGFRRRVLDEEGKLHQFVNVFVNDEDIRFMEDLGTPVGDGDTISILPAVAGG